MYWKKCFWWNFEQKSIFGDEIWALEAFCDTKTLKLGLSTTSCRHGGLKAKTKWPFFTFFCTRANHLRPAIDRAQSELFRTFFLDQMRFLSRPKWRQLFLPIFAFWPFLRFRSFLIFFTIFQFLEIILPAFDIKINISINIS